MKASNEVLDSWWYKQDFQSMEKITGYTQSDFSSEEGYAEFVEQCDDWWEKKSNDEKNRIYEEHH